LLRVTAADAAWHPPVLPEPDLALQGWGGDWNISPMRRGWGSWACSAWRREGW